jgi:hypothetical protein
MFDFSCQCLIFGDSFIRRRYLRRVSPIERSDMWLKYSRVGNWRNSDCLLLILYVHTL